MNRAELIRTFQSLEFQPRSRLGQNFLIDGNLATKLVELAAIKPGQTVLEVGPGMGMISRKILDAGARLVAIEFDHRLVQGLREQLFSAEAPQNRLIEGDAVEMPSGDMEDITDCIVIANPPFSITGPWLAGLLEVGFPQTLSLLLQRDAVDRIASRAGSKKFGPLAIRLEAAYKCIAKHPVPPQSFYPPPTIESQIVVFRRLQNPRRFHPDFLKRMQSLFAHRRKQIGGTLRKQLDESEQAEWQHILQSHGFSFQSRPEQIPTPVWCALDTVSNSSDTH